MGAQRSKRSLSADGNSSESVAAALRRAIQSGQLATGARLPPTRQLAQQHRVSRTTVQRALGALQGEGLIECRARSGNYVRQVAVEPTAARTGRQIGVGFGQLEAPFAARGERWVDHIVSSARTALGEVDFEMLMLAHWKTSPEAVAAFFERIDRLDENLAGVLLVQPAALNCVQQGLDERSIPWVVINRPNLQFRHNFVCADNIQGGWLVGRAFARLGYERILMLGSDPAAYPSGRERLTGLIQGYIEHTGRMPRALDHLICTNSHEQNGYEAAQTYLHENDPPDAVFAIGDYLALGAMRALRERGVEAGRDVGVVGGTGLELAAYVHPSLSVVTQPMSAIGRVAARLLTHMAATGRRRVAGVAVPCRMMVRDSLPMPDDLRAELAADDDDSDALPDLSDLDRTTFTSSTETKP